MDDRYVPNYREDDDPFERRARSPSRASRGESVRDMQMADCVDLEARVRPRTPSPYRALALAHRINDAPPWSQRKQRQRSRVPSRIFEGLRFHCFSSTTAGMSEAKLMGSKLRVSSHHLFVPLDKDARQREGGIGCMHIRSADVVIVFPRDSQQLKTVKSQYVPPFHGHRDSDMTVEQLYFQYAARLDRGADQLSRNRKCVVQAEWATQRLKQRRWVPNQNRDEWEIM
jgi:hypothetical protein